MAATTIPMTRERTNKQRRAGVSWLLMVLALVICSAIGAWWLRKHDKAPEQTPRADWIAPMMQSISNAVNATGTVKLKTGAEVRVGAQLSGIVKQLYVTVGSHIRKGDVIAIIDSRAVIAKIDQVKSQLGQAEVALSKASNDYSRAEKLFQEGLIPLQQFEDAKAAQQVAQAAVTTTQSALETARVDLDYVEIRAPISGTVASVSTQQGETVAAAFATPTFVTIIQESALEVVAMVDEADIGNVRRGESVTFTTETWPAEEFTGTVTRIAPVATILSGVVNYQVGISVTRDIERLRPDMTTNVNIHTAEHRALMIPVRCVHKEGAQSYVYVRTRSGAAEKRTIGIGPRSGDKEEVTRGLDVTSKVQMESGDEKP